MVDPVAEEPLTMVVLMVVTVNVLIVLEKDKEVPLVNLEKAQEHYTQEEVEVAVMLTAAGLLLKVVQEAAEAETLPIPKQETV